MTDVAALSRIVQISRCRLEAARQVMIRAEAAMSAAQSDLDARMAEANEISARKSQLKAEAEIAFCKSPQTAAAVVRLIENNTAQDKKAQDACNLVEDARAVLEQCRADRKQAGIAFGKLEQELNARDGMHRRLSRIAARQTEVRREAILNDERVALLRREQHS